MERFDSHQIFHLFLSFSKFIYIPGSTMLWGKVNILKTLKECSLFKIVSFRLSIYRTVWICNIYILYIDNILECKTRKYWTWISNTTVNKHCTAQDKAAENRGNVVINFNNLLILFHKVLFNMQGRKRH
jgi:hypothetical protein